MAGAQALGPFNLWPSTGREKAILKMTVLQDGGDVCCWHCQELKLLRTPLRPCPVGLAAKEACGTGVTWQAHRPHGHPRSSCALPGMWVHSTALSAWQPAAVM